MEHVCPWWGGYFIDNSVRRWIHNPVRILQPYVTLGMRTMDFGCGMGLYAIAFARLVGSDGSVVAVDLQQPMLDTVKKRAAKVGLAGRIQTHRCSKNAIDLQDCFDFVVASYSAHEVPDAGRLFRELYELLRPGGAFLLIEPILHVTRTRFSSMLDRAQSLGFEFGTPPRVRWSHTALLVRPNRVCSKNR